MLFPYLFFAFCFAAAGFSAGKLSNGMTSPRIAFNGFIPVFGLIGGLVIGLFVATFSIPLGSSVGFFFATIGICGLVGIASAAFGLIVARCLR